MQRRKLPKMSHWVRKDISKAYASFRPEYPEALFEFIRDRFASKERDVRARTVAVDVGCGTGQATKALSRCFDEVIGVDPSPTQINSANESTPDAQKNNVRYFVGNSDHFDEICGSNVADFVGVFQAAHWFDMKKFSSACARAAKKRSSSAGDGGAVGLVTYTTVRAPDNLQLSQSIDSMDKMLHRRGYWPPERRHIDDKYQMLCHEFCLNGWELIETKEFSNQVEVSLSHFLNYLSTWSSLDRLEQAHIRSLSQEGASNENCGEGGMKTVLDEYIVNVLREQRASLNENELLESKICLEFPVLSHFFRSS